MQRALTRHRESDFPQWYQEVVRAADLAEFAAGVRGCMVIKPWGYAIWELIRDELDRRIKATGHHNCYFPLFIPLSFISREAEHAEGFAKEMAVVTHHRLKAKDGKLQPDPEAELTEPLIVRPTSETIIGDAFSRWIQSHRDLPLLINQWANVVRWEMRPRLFLRTIEFLWQEGHTAHATAEEARAHTMRMLEMYREVSEDALAVPVIVGEKSENEKFAGAVSSLSIEAMMQDGKALQMGTSHYLGTNFAEAQGIKFQSEKGGVEFCHTTSWGVSTRLIGGVIMTHGDDDGLRLPPPIAPHQIVIVPITRGKGEDEATIAYCQKLAEALRGSGYRGAAVRAHVDVSAAKPQDKRWNWVKRGVPVIVEVGGREASGEAVTYIRRDRVRENEKVKIETLPFATFVSEAGSLLSEIFTSMMSEAEARTRDNIRGGISNFDELAAYFGEVSDDDDSTFKGWVRAPWSKPTGAALDEIVARLKTLKLTIRNAPFAQPAQMGPCLFTGKKAVQEVLISRAY